MSTTTPSPDAEREAWNGRVPPAHADAPAHLLRTMDARGRWKEHVAIQFGGWMLAEEGAVFDRQHAAAHYEYVGPLYLSATLTTRAERAEAALAVALAREARLRELVRQGQSAVNAAYSQALAEYQGHDTTASKHDRVVTAWREEARAALATSEPQPAADMCSKDGMPCYVGAGGPDTHHRCGTTQCGMGKPQPAAEGE